MLEVLNRKKALKGAKVERVVFNAITKSAVTEAMKHPRDIDMELVDAYLARRALDYLVGFTLSPVLWRKLPGARSAGRVQSVALRLVVDREVEIEALQDPGILDRRGRRLGRRRALPGPAGQARGQAAHQVRPGQRGRGLRRPRRGRGRRASRSRRSRRSRPAARPPPPFTTSTLQQEASRKLGFSAQRTMQAAQQLYEGVDIGGETVGLITYMRTDGVQTAPEALDEAREVIGGLYGRDYVPEKPRIYKTKAKNAQEAHEAIRPTSLARNPGTLRLEPDLGRLYELIWKRMIASQMESRAHRAHHHRPGDRRRQDRPARHRPGGALRRLPGGLRGRPRRRRRRGGRRPPAAGRRRAPTAQVLAARADQHFTEPPPRYSEASLVKKMEELGIGRPSTYASILTVLRDRDYVRMDKNRFVPEDKGRLVTAFLEQFFRRYVEYDFTADLEEKLDLVSAGELDWKALLRDFWTDFHAAVERDRRAAHRARCSTR